VNTIPTVPAPQYSGKTIQETYLNILAEIATKHLSPTSGKARVAASIVYKNNLVSCCMNEKKTHPFQAKYKSNDHSIWLHAETNAIKTALKVLTLDELSKSTLYITRIKYVDAKRTGLEFGNSKPCEGCFRCINTFQIRKVIYSIDSNDYGEL